MFDNDEVTSVSKYQLWNVDELFFDKNLEKKNRKRTHLEYAMTSIEFVVYGMYLYTRNYCYLGAIRCEVWTWVVCVHCTHSTRSCSANAFNSNLYNISFWNKKQNICWLQPRHCYATETAVYKSISFLLKNIRYLKFET